MGKDGEISLLERDIKQINRDLRILEKHIEKFGEAQRRKDPGEFNSIKREIIKLQRKISGIV
jgi:peptidoglycan hydrolase CwlO-like protein